jgi:GNAT superfamily N-acetyltransferase
MAPVSALVIHRQLQPADRRAIAELHRAVYVPEFGLNDVFVRGVADGVEAAVASGWPERSGAVWLIGESERLTGCLALTDEGAVGRVRWFVLAPELRGQGVGRRLMGELLDEARRAGHSKLELERFSALTAAARIYRSAGFRVTWERIRAETPDLSCIARQAGAGAGGSVVPRMLLVRNATGLCCRRPDCRVTQVLSARPRDQPHPDYFPAAVWPTTAARLPRR